MKRSLIVLFSAFAALFFSGAVYAQENPECITYMSYYQEYYKQKNYKDAFPNWRKAFNLCPPNYRQNLYIQGSALVRDAISRNRKDPEVVKGLLDTLLLLQDRRLQYYPMATKTINGVKTKVETKPEILNNKGNYMINYISYRENGSKYLYENLSPIVAELGSVTAPSILVNLLDASIDLYRKGELEADAVISTYETVAAAIGGSDLEDEDNKVAKANIDMKFADSKVASCDNLIAIFTPRFEADPENIGVVSNIVRLMNNAEDCAGNDLYYKAVHQLYKLTPSAGAAYGLYKLNAAKGNVAEAVKYLEDAIASDESDAATDAQYYYELARFNYANGLRGKAYEAARKAVDMDYGYAGKAYLILGGLWASASCSGDVEKYARYWVATDYYQKAKAADETLAEDANSSISNVARYYPPASEIFMYDLGPGQSYTVSCGGMTATTTVRVSR